MWYEDIMDTSQLMLTGKVAVVTGAARGIGKATALAFADLGATVAVCDLLKDELDETVNELGSKALTHTARLLMFVMVRR